MAKSQNQAGMIAAQITAAATVSGGKTGERLSQHGQKTYQPGTGKNAQSNPNHIGNGSDVDRKLAANVDAIHGILNGPGNDDTHQSQNHTQNHLQRSVGCEIIAVANAAEKADAAADGTEQIDITCPAQIHFLHTGDGAGNFHAKPRVGSSGGVHHVALGEQTVEAAVFKGSPFVAHGHALLQVYAAALVRDNFEVAQLRPGIDHHGQVCTGGGQMTTQFAGGHTFQCFGAALTQQGQAAH